MVIEASVCFNGNQFSGCFTSFYLQIYVSEVSVWKKSASVQLRKTIIWRGELVLVSF